MYSVLFVQYDVERKGTLAGPSIVLSSAYDRLEPKRVTVDGAYVHATEDLEVNVAYVKDQEGKEVVEQIELLRLATTVDQETEDQLQVGSTRCPGAVLPSYHGNPGYACHQY